MAKLRVCAVGTALATDYDAIEAGVRRFAGRRVDPEKGGFVPMDEPDEISARAEHVQAVREGDLEAADEATAAICGVKLKTAAAPKKTPKEI